MVNTGDDGEDSSPASGSAGEAQSPSSSDTAASVATVNGALEWMHNLPSMYFHVCFAGLPAYYLPRTVGGI